MKTAITIDNRDFTISFDGTVKIYETFDEQNLAVTRLLSENQILALINDENKSQVFIVNKAKADTELNRK